MSNILTLPTRSNLAGRELDAAFAAFDVSADGSADHYLALQRITKIALTGQCSEMRQRAARWLLDVHDVDVAMLGLGAAKSPHMPKQARSANGTRSRTE